MGTKFAVIQAVGKDLSPRFHGLKADVFCRVPRSEFDSPAKVGDPIWRENVSYEDLAEEVEKSFPGAVCIAFDRYDKDDDMLKALGDAFDGNLNIDKHNAFRGVHLR